ncbi:hypothetical protein [Gloeothece verrucosa]|uniref:LRAT domain-containing protein n=1 Tax=Gloeothece verrucosa (strain PCC 7822) TaxID=497965 RepID=E0UJN0_GLOV7|nr:hypothetical protein [Gloeothece verrucosa]ADN12274.1 hypothetical protein Cyan7822_0225 [Gloeothece verrucosa PCC 7822]
MKKPKNPSPAKILYLFAELHNHLGNGTIRHQLSQIVRHSKDAEIIDICRRAADCLEIEIDDKFNKLDTEQHSHSLKTLVNHLAWAKNKFDEILKLRDECNPKWTESIFKATEIQLIELSNCYTLLDKIPDITDKNDEVVKIGDLVAVRCKDEKDQEYDHYGVLISSPKGYRVAHFFTGATVKAQNSLAEKGFGYVHETFYSPDWIVKEHLPTEIPYSQVEQRIKESRKLDKRVWSKFTYNCEHWAREMVYNKPECTQFKRGNDQI